MCFVAATKLLLFVPTQHSLPVFNPAFSLLYLCIILGIFELVLIFDIQVVYGAERYKSYRYYISGMDLRVL